MKLRLVLLVCCLVNALPALVHAQSYSAIYVFGDSLNDTGNLWMLIGKTWPPPPYYDGRFSNGPLWVEQFAESLHLPVQPLLAGGTNYAFSGAILAEDSSVPGIPVEVALYLFLKDGKADPNALYILEGGINDILRAELKSPGQLGTNIANTLAFIETQLNAAGAKHFLIMNLPDVSAFPAAASIQSYASAASVSANRMLQQLVADARTLQGVDIQILDLYSFYGNIVQDPGGYGFTNATTSCLTDLQVCGDPGEVFFWDDVHTTEAAQALLATQAESLY